MNIVKYKEGKNMRNVSHSLITFTASCLTENSGNVIQMKSTCFDLFSDEGAESTDLFPLALKK